MDRNDYCKLEILRYRSALDRLSNISKSFDIPVNLILLEEKIKHLESRATMHKNRLRRIPAIVNELIQLRYYRYSRNWGSVAMDLFFR